MDKDIMAKAVKVKELTEYQENSVVSRTLIDKGKGTVTLFSFDAGQGLSEHTAPFDAMAVVTDGEALVTIDGQENLVKENEMIIMPADKPHSLKAEKKFKMMLVMIRA